MPDPFDGTGKPYGGGSYRGILTVLVVSIAVICVLWVLYGQVIDTLPSNVRPS